MAAINLIKQTIHCDQRPHILRPTVIQPTSGSADNELIKLDGGSVEDVDVGGNRYEKGKYTRRMRWLNSGRHIVEKIMTHKISPDVGRLLQGRVNQDAYTV